MEEQTIFEICHNHLSYDASIRESIILEGTAIAMAEESTRLLSQHVFYGDIFLTAGFTRFPITPDHAIIELHNTDFLTAKDCSTFIDIMITTRRLALALSTVSPTHRCALVFDGATRISLIPLHGLDKDWRPIIHEAIEYHQSYPGYITSKSGPMLSNADLNATRKLITAVSGLTNQLDLTFLGPSSDQNLFARIIRGELQSWKLWEDRSHVAFLTPFANTPGFTVLVPRTHFSSDILSLSDEEYSDLLCAAHKCVNILIKAFSISQCGFIFEGYEVDYAHVKLIPIHQRHYNEDTSDQASQHTEYHMTYNGYVTSQLGPPLGNLNTVLDATDAMREALDATKFFQ